jgi:dTDP-4-amino-4,6-dideoxygalactose transaminase
MTVRNRNFGLFHQKKLAINGGQPVRTKPWRDNVTTGPEERQAAGRVLDRGYLSLFEGSHTPDPPFSFWGGPEILALERQWGEYYGVKYAVSMNSATSGLYAAIGALGLGYGDEIIVSPYTMSACATCALVYGAIPIFADVCLETGSLDPKSVAAQITDRTRAIVVVHQFGIPADMDSILALAQKYDLKVIEDCAQAHGAKYRGSYVGTMGDIGVFSLNVNKTIQVGEGGVCLTNDEELRYRLGLIRNHGEAVVGAAGYEPIDNIIGFNYRLTEIAAAMAGEQLKKLEAFNQMRWDFVDFLNESLGKYAFLQTPPRCPHSPECRECQATYYVYPLRYLPEVLGVAREEFVRVVNAEGVHFYPGYVKPLYFQPVYQKKQAFKHGYPFAAPENQGIATNYYLGACPNAEKLHFEQMLINEHIRWPHNQQDMDDIVKIFKKIFD